MQKYVLPILLILLVSGQVCSEPSRTTQTLMNTQLNMLDWGMYRCSNFYQNGGGAKMLKQIISEVVSSDQKYDEYVEEDCITPSVLCLFEWDTDQIVIRIDLYGINRNGLSDIKFLRKLCRNITNFVKEVDNEENFMLDNFLQRNYPSLEEIKGIIRTDVRIVGLENKALKIYFSSKTDTLSGDLLFSQ